MNFESEADGSFDLSPISDSPIAVYAQLNEFLPTTRLTLDMKRDIHLTIDAGENRTIRVTGTKKALLPTIVPTRATSRPRNGIFVRRENDGEFTALGVQDGIEYDVWIPPGESGQYALARRARFDEDGLSIQVADHAAWIESWVSAPDDTESIEGAVELRPGLAYISSRAASDGRFRIGPIESGEFIVRIEAKSKTGDSYTWSGRLSTERQNERISIFK